MVLYRGHLTVKPRPGPGSGKSSSGGWITGSLPESVPMGRKAAYGSKVSQYVQSLQEWSSKTEHVGAGCRPQLGKQPCQIASLAEEAIHRSSQRCRPGSVRKGTPGRTPENSDAPLWLLWNAMAACLAFHMQIHDHPEKDGTEPDVPEVLHFIGNQWSMSFSAADVLIA